MSLNPNSNDDLLKNLGVERDQDTYKINLNSTSHITLVLKNLTDKIDELRKSQSTISEQPKKSEISKNIDELRKASLDILFTEYKKQYDDFDASIKSKKIDPEALEAGFKSHQEALKAYIEYYQKEGLKPNQYSLLNSDVKKLAKCYEEAHNQGLSASKKLSRAEFEEVLISGNDEHSKKIDFDTSSNLPLNAVIIRHSDCIKELKSPKKEDSFLSQVSSIIHKSFSDASKSLTNINPDNDWGTESWNSGISKGLGFNSNSPSHSSLPDTLSKFVNSIHEFKAPGSIPFFEPPPQWSQNLSGPNLPQPNWLNSALTQSTSFFTSLSGVFASEKQEPSTKDDKSIQAEIRRRVEKSLAERLTASPKTKPNSHEEALERRKSSPAITPPVPMRRASSAPLAPARAAPPVPMRRASSAPPGSLKKTPTINKELRIEFFGGGTKGHKEHPDSDHPEAKRRREETRPEANGPSRPTASTFPPQTKKTRTK